MAEEGAHAEAGDPTEGGEFDGIVAAVEVEGLGIAAVGAEGREHLGGEFGEEGGVVFAGDHEAVLPGSQAALDVGHGADGGPEVAQLVEADFIAQAFPDVIGGHAVFDDIGEVCGDVEEASGADRGVVDQGDVADGGTNAGAKNAEARIALLLEPAQALAGVGDGLAVGLEGEADIGADELVGALVALDHAAVVVRQAHAQDANSKELQPLAKGALPFPLGVPIGEEDDGGVPTRPGQAAAPRPDRVGASGKELSMDEIVFAGGVDWNHLWGGGGGGNPVIEPLGGR